jgi:hypothetical protein
MAKAKGRPHKGASQVHGLYGTGSSGELTANDIGGTRFWRVDGKADYSVLDSLASQRINTALIIQHCEDLLRLAGSLKLGTVQAAGLIRTLQTKDRPDQAGTHAGGTGPADQDDLPAPVH